MAAICVMFWIQNLELHNGKKKQNVTALAAFKATIKRWKPIFSRGVCQKCVGFV